MSLEGVGLRTDFVGGLHWRQTQNFGGETEIAVVETIGVDGISLADLEV